MKVAVVGPLELPKAQGGVTRHCEEIYARIAAAGHDVTILCGGGPAPDTVYRGMRIRKLRTARSAGWERLTYAVSTAIAATTGDYDIVHYHSFASSGFCALPKLRRRKIVTTAHRVEWQDAKWGRLTREFLRFSEWAAVRCSDALIAVSQALADDLTGRFPGAANVSVISNGVTHPEAAGVEELDALGLTDRGFLLTVGRIVPEKGVDVAIDAYLELLRRGDPPVDLVIVGGARQANNEVERALRARAEAAGGRVHFLGIRQPETVALLYERARALVAPSYQEGQPLVVAEAMSHGCVVVASDIAAHVELLAGTGVLFPAGDASALADRVTWVFEHPDDAREYGERARERVAAGDFSWDHAATETERVLLSV